MCQLNKAIHTKHRTARPAQNKDANTAALAIILLLLKERGLSQGAGEVLGRWTVGGQEKRDDLH